MEPSGSKSPDPSQSQNPLSTESPSTADNSFQSPLGFSEYRLRSRTARSSSNTSNRSLCNLSLDGGGSGSDRFLRSACRDRNHFGDKNCLCPEDLLNHPRRRRSSSRSRSRSRLPTPNSQSQSPSEVMMNHSWNGGGPGAGGPAGDSLFTPNRPRSRPILTTTGNGHHQSHLSHSHSHLSSSSHRLSNGSISSLTHANHLSNHSHGLGKSFNEEDVLLETSESLSEKTSILTNTKKSASFFNFSNSQSDLISKTMAYYNGIGETYNRRRTNTYYTSDDDEDETSNTSEFIDNSTTTPSATTSVLHKINRWLFRIPHFIGFNIYKIVMFFFLAEKWLLKTRRVSSASHRSSNNVPLSTSTPLFSARVPEHSCGTGRGQSRTGSGGGGNGGGSGPCGHWCFKLSGTLVAFLLVAFLAIYFLGFTGPNWAIFDGITSAKKGETIPTSHVQCPSQQPQPTSSPVQCPKHLPQPTPTPCSIDPSKIQSLESQIQQLQKELAKVTATVSTPPPPQIDYSDKIAKCCTMDVDARINNLQSQIVQNENKKTCPDPKVVANNGAQINALRGEINTLKNIIDNIPTPKCDCPEAAPPAPTGGFFSGLGGSGSDACVDLINDAIAKYDADKTGQADLALESGGGSVVNTRCTKQSEFSGTTVSIFGIPIYRLPNSPRKIIQPGTLPGDCWSFEGAQGWVVVKLVGPTVMKGFSLEHMAKALSPTGNIDTAPKKFQVVGLMQEENNNDEHIFGEYEYQEDGKPLQYFSVQNPVDVAFPYVELKILSNQGDPSYTCIYRFRVHGELKI